MCVANLITSTAKPAGREWSDHLFFRRHRGRHHRNVQKPALLINEEQLTEYTCATRLNIEQRIASVATATLFTCSLQNLAVAGSKSATRRSHDRCD